MAVAVVWPLLHRKVTAPVPPLVDTVAEPLPPVQGTGIVAEIVAVKAELGCVTVAEEVAVQPLASVAVTV